MNSLDLGIQSSLGNPQKYRKGCLMAPKQSWQQLAEQASTETDSARMLEIVTELNRVLGEREETTRQQRHHGEQPKSYRATA
ncbi:MAG: hypothetical protein JWO91_1672 [Acidobacteriaceae bacterium]|nr:hypothetical protein [Acidobacteriaceae bacterium]